VVVRRIGYGLFDGMLPFAINEVVERNVLLTPIAVLEKVVVSAERAVIPSFEEHRRTGLGRFLTREELAPQEGRRLSDILTQVSGVDIVTGNGNRSWIVTNRGLRSLRAASCELDEIDVIRGAKLCACYAQVYLDNSLVYRGEPGEPLFDLNRMVPAQIEAIEFYAGPAQTPLRYGGLNSVCGVLVIHTRRSP
jgi:outer membrane receptor for ferrienterochelin and colicin